MGDRKKTLRDPVRKQTPRPRQIIFKFKEDVLPRTKNGVLKKIRSWEEVVSVEQVFKGVGTEISTHLLNLYAVYVHTEKQVDPALQRLMQSFPDIEQAYLPPQRSLR